MSCGGSFSPRSKRGVKQLWVKDRTSKCLAVSLNAKSLFTLAACSSKYSRSVEFYGKWIYYLWSKTAVLFCCILFPSRALSEVTISLSKTKNKCQDSTTFLWIYDMCKVRRHLLHLFFLRLNKCSERRARCTLVCVCARVRMHLDVSRRSLSGPCVL